MDLQQKFTLGVYQGSPVPGNIEATMELMSQVVKESAHKGVNLVVFPELFITGYLPDLWSHIPNPEEENLWLQQLTSVSKQHQVWIVFGHPSYRVQPQTSPDMQARKASAVPGVSSPSSISPSPMTNAVSLVSPSGIAGSYAKVHLFGNEEETFVCGNEYPVYETPFGKIALQICYDIEFPEAARVAALKGADLLINPSNNMTPYGMHHKVYTMSRAMENGMFVAAVNRTRPERDIDFCGQSCVAHPKGKYLLELDREEGLFTTEINLQDRAALADAVQYLKQRRPETYGALTDLSLPG